MDQDRAAFLAEFGNRVKTLRTQKEMTLEELAKKIGYTTENARSSMQKIEAGKSDPPASRIRSLAAALDVSVSFLMGWDEMDQVFPVEKIQSESTIFDLLKESHGETTCEAVSMYLQLDSSDQGEIRGEMKHMLKADKYAIQKESKHAQAI